MTAIVIDTNVLLVADGQASQMTNACRIECLNKLDEIHTQNRVVLDTAWIILGEYQHKLSPKKRPPSPGSLFLLWLLQRYGDPRHVVHVKITPRDPPHNTLFEEFPKDAALEADFDPADRKFVAAANAHAEKPPIVEAADTKWIDWEISLARHGIRIEFLCRAELDAIRKRKTT